MKCSNCKQAGHNARSCRYMSREMFADKYHSQDVPQWFNQFLDDLDKVIETELEDKHCFNCHCPSRERLY